MFLEKTQAGFELFLDTHFPCYRSDWETLSDEGRDFLLSFLSSKHNRDFEYVRTLSDASYIATGLYDFACCRDMAEISSWIRGDLKGNVVFATEKQIDTITESLTSDGRKLLELMEENPRAVSVFFIFYAYNYRVTEAGFSRLFSVWKSDPSNQKKTVEDPEKGMKHDDYIRFIDAYFDEHPLRNISYQFSTINGSQHVIEISCLKFKRGYKRSEMKYLIPVIEYADSHFFEICTASFLNDALATARIIEEDGSKASGTEWKYSLIEL